MKNCSVFSIPSFLFLLIVSVSCSNPDTEAVKKKKCPFWGCSGNNICLKNMNICVRQCKTDSDCPGDLLCKKYFRDDFSFSGRKEKFCFTADAVEGDSCGRFDSACGKGLSCVDGKCRKICQENNECSDGYGCLMEVLSSDSLDPDTTYKVCAKASLLESDKCHPSKEPMCKVDHICLENTCRRICVSDEDCPDSKKCSGRGTSGWKGRLRYFKGQKADFRYCQ
ncbi:MAG: hypothetical protein JXR95_11750 [Deltaproteobacteria bacterium]|nr:hypothetical protein [Deltaproteobacteria bacterium]